MTTHDSDAYLGRQLPWVREKLAKLVPGYRFKWDIYFDRLEELARQSEAFLDAGCGDNRTSAELEGPTVRLGIDLHRKAEFGTYICANLENVPFAEETFDLVGCRYVVEHLEEPMWAFSELRRVMKPGAHILIQTVNRASLLIFFSRALGPRIRRLISRRRYARKSDDIFPVHDRFNTTYQFEHPPNGFRFVSLEMTQDIDTQSRLGFWISYFLMRTLCRHPHTRSTITAEWERV